MKICADDPSFGAGDGSLDILCEPAPEPGESAFNDPSLRQNLEAPGMIGALDDLQSPGADPGQASLQFLAAVAPIGEDVMSIGAEMAYP